MENSYYYTGYEEALEDMLELLDNALANGYTTHTYHELVEQLAILKDQLEN